VLALVEVILDELVEVLVGVLEEVAGSVSVGGAGGSVAGGGRSEVAGGELLFDWDDLGGFSSSTGGTVSTLLVVEGEASLVLNTFLGVDLEPGFAVGIFLGVDVEPRLEVTTVTPFVEIDKIELVACKFLSAEK